MTTSSNACEFCKMMCITTLFFAAVFGFIFILGAIRRDGIDTVCWQAQLDAIHLTICDKSAYPVEVKP